MAHASRNFCTRGMGCSQSMRQELSARKLGKVAKRKLTVTNRIDEGINLQMGCKNSFGGFRQID